MSDEWTTPGDPTTPGERTMPGDETAPARKRYRFDPGGVLTGLFFLAVAGVGLSTGLSGEPTIELRLLVPAVLVGLGVVGIVRVFTRSRRRRLR